MFYVFYWQPLSCVSHVSPLQYLCLLLCIFLLEIIAGILAYITYQEVKCFTLCMGVFVNMTPQCMTALYFFSISLMLFFFLSIYFSDFTFPSFSPSCLLNLLTTHLNAAVAALSVVKSSLYAALCMLWSCFFPPFSRLSFFPPFLAPVFPFLLPGNLLSPVNDFHFISTCLSNSVFTLCILSVTHWENNICTSAFKECSLVRGSGVRWLWVRGGLHKYSGML